VQFGGWWWCVPVRLQAYVHARALPHYYVNLKTLIATRHTTHDFAKNGGCEATANQNQGFVNCYGMNKSIMSVMGTNLDTLDTEGSAAGNTDRLSEPFYGGTVIAATQIAPTIGQGSVGNDYSSGTQNNIGSRSTIETRPAVATNLQHMSAAMRQSRKEAEHMYKTSAQRLQLELQREKLVTEAIHRAKQCNAQLRAQLQEAPQQLNEAKMKLAEIAKEVGA
jgi:hypothetical protein